MSALDFSRIIKDGVFQIELTNREVSGNRKLVNIFEFCFLTSLKTYLSGGKYYVDNFAGNAFKYIGQPFIQNELDTLSAGIGIAVDKTVTALKGDEVDSTPDTEKILSASVKNLYEEKGMVYVIIEVIPLDVESWDNLKFQLPITKREE